MATVEGRDDFGEDPKFFIGEEVEKTPLFGKQTLFVIGKQNPKEIIKADVWVTLDFDSGYANHEWFHDNGWNEYDKFIPMIAVRLPYVKQFNYNATIKLDDREFKGTNSGVWCHNLHDLMDRRNYTDWSNYVGDKVID